MMKRLKRILKLGICYSIWFIGIIDSIIIYFGGELLDNFTQLPLWKTSGIVITLVLLGFITSKIFYELSNQVQRWKEFYERNNSKDDPKV